MQSVTSLQGKGSNRKMKLEPELLRKEKEFHGYNAIKRAGNFFCSKSKNEEGVFFNGLV